MNEGNRLAAAEFAAEAARERFLDSFHELVRHLEPKRLAKGLWEDAKVKGADLAEEAVDAVKARPVAATGVVAALALFLAREPIIDLAGKMMSPKEKKNPARKPRQTKKAAAPSAPSETMESKS